MARLIPRIFVRKQLAVDQFAKDVADHDMGFLDARCVPAGNAEKDFHRTRHLASRFSRQSDGVQSLRFCGGYTVQDIRRVATGGYCDYGIAGLTESGDLAREDGIETVVVADRCEDRCICGKRDSGQGSAFDGKSADEFCRYMLGISRASAIAEQ